MLCHCIMLINYCQQPQTHNCIINYTRFAERILLGPTKIGSFCSSPRVTHPSLPAAGRDCRLASLASASVAYCHRKSFRGKQSLGKQCIVNKFFTSHQGRPMKEGHQVTTFTFLGRRQVPIVGTKQLLFTEQKNVFNPPDTQS